MALQLTYTSPDGVTHPAAYARVTTIIVTRHPAQAPTVRYWLDIHATRQARNDARREVGTVEGEYESDNVSVTIAEIYAAAKALPVFQAAADV